VSSTPIKASETEPNSDTANDSGAKKNTTNDREILERLSYGVSHDLGASLRSMLRFSELLKQRASDRLEEREIYWLSLMIDSGKRAQIMLDAMLEYSRLSTRMPATAIDLNVLIDNVWRDCCAQYQNQFPDTKQPELKIVNTLPNFTGVAEHWHRFFSNILLNAILFQRKAEDDGCQITISSSSIRNNSSISIEDNGIGVSEEQRPNLGRHFWRGHAEQDYPGVGMGLALCERIGQLHGGKISYENGIASGLKVVYTYGTD
jgi:Signal transduction histidine kinase